MKNPTPQSPLMAFICAPYRGQGDDPYTDCDNNIAAARQTALTIASMGIYPFTSHLNTGHFDFAVPRQYPQVHYQEELYLSGCLRILSGCDVLFLLGERMTEGMKGEVAFANTHGIPVISSIKDLRSWLEDLGRVSDVPS